MAIEIPGPINVGVGISTITPPVGVELCGYGVYLKRQSRGVHDDLYSKTIVVEGKDKNRIALISIDLIGLSKDTVRKCKIHISKNTGIDWDNILITCTHTHSGPATAFLRGWGEVDEKYVKELPAKISESVVIACNSLEPAHIGFARGEVDFVSFNRLEKNGPIDPTVGVMGVYSYADQPLSILFNFACHAVTIDRRTPAGNLISRDWPGYTADMIKSESGAEGIFLQGTAGDIDPVVAWHNFEFEGAVLTGNVLSMRVMDVVKNMRISEVQRVILKKKIVHLPLDILSEEKIDSITENEKKNHNWDENWVRFYEEWSKSMKEKLRTKSYKKTSKGEIAALRLDSKDSEGIILFLPGEVFVRLGLEIKKNSPFKNIFIAGYYDKYQGYIPDRFDFGYAEKAATLEEGDTSPLRGYAATVVPRIIDTFPYKKNVGEILTEEAENLVNKI